MASIFVVVRSDGALIGSPFFNSRDAEVHGVRGDDRYRVVEYAPVEPWVLVRERLPEDGQEVEYIRNFQSGETVRARHIRTFYRNVVYAFGGEARAEEVHCWRPARPIGELPEGRRG